MSEKTNGLSEKAEAAFQATAVSVIERARQTGTPVVLWENGRIKEISSERLESTPLSRPMRPAHGSLPTAD